MQINQAVKHWAVLGGIFTSLGVYESFAFPSGKIVDCSKKKDGDACYLFKGTSGQNYPLKYLQGAISNKSCSVSYGEDNITSHPFGPSCYSNGRMCTSLVLCIENP